MDAAAYHELSPSLRPRAPQDEHASSPWPITALKNETILAHRNNMFAKGLLTPAELKAVVVDDKVCRVIHINAYSYSICKVSVHSGARIKKIKLRFLQFESKNDIQ